MKYVQPVGAAVNAAYVDANPVGGVEGSPVPAAALEHPQREIENAITAAGLVPSAGDLTQLSKAIVKLAAAYGIGGSAVAIPGGNLDSAAIPGGVYYTSPSDLGTKPATDDGYGHVMVSREGTAGVTARQIYQNNGSIDIWVRCYTSTAWTPWVKLATANDLAALLPINGSAAMNGALKAKSGAMGAGNPNNCGYVFGGDGDSGMFSSSDGVLELGLNGQLVFKAVGAGRTFYFGPGNLFRLELLLDGNVAIFDNTGATLFSAYDFAAIYSRSLSVSGYQKLPGGLILQWGSGSYAKSTAYSFPIAFPTACLAWVGNHIGIDSTATPTTTAKTAAQFTMTWTNATNPTNQQWFALGY